MSYGRSERLIARLLDSMPGVKKVVKVAYQRANFAARRLAGRGGPPAWVHPEVPLRAALPGAPAQPRAIPDTFFGYFGTSPWSRSGRLQLVHRWNRRNPAVVDVCLVDERQGSYRTIGSSDAWTFQQGTMAQWMQTQQGEAVIFNMRVARKLVSRIVSLDGVARDVPWPVQALRPGCAQGTSINYRRLATINEYGYDVDADNFRPDQAAEEDGIWRVDFTSGKGDLILSLADLMKRAARSEMQGARHEVNHVVYSPDGNRFVFMHRWTGRSGKFSRLYCADADGSDLRLLLDHRMVSHYAWRDDSTLVVWARTAAQGDRYYLLDVRDGQATVLGKNSLDRHGDGHPSFSPSGDWLVTDTYPDRDRRRRLLLFHVPTNRLVEIGRFFSPWHFDGAERCDLHPRWSPDGRRVSVDSTHEGSRQSYVLDVSTIVLGGA
jgi:hypothetical protein